VANRALNYLLNIILTRKEVPPQVTSTFRKSGAGFVANHYILYISPHESEIVTYMAEHAKTIAYTPPTSVVSFSC